MVDSTDEIAATSERSPIEPGYLDGYLDGLSMARRVFVGNTADADVIIKHELERIEKSLKAGA